jgi:hypothetical protein
MVGFVIIVSVDCPAYMHWPLKSRFRIGMFDWSNSGKNSMIGPLPNLTNKNDYNIAKTNQSSNNNEFILS